MFSFGPKPMLARLHVGAVIVLCCWLQAASIHAQAINSTALATVQRSSHSDFLFISFPLGGFYLVSLPMTVADSSVSTLFPMALGAFSWERNHYEPASSMTRGRGYWLAIPGPATAVIQGTPLAQFTLHCFPGFNLIGSVLDSVNFSDPNDTPNGSIFLPAFRWDPATQRYVATTTLEQSYGHWIAALQECDVIVQAQTLIALPNSQEEARKQVFYQAFDNAPPPPPWPRQ